MFIRHTRPDSFLRVVPHVKPEHYSTWCIQMKFELYGDDELRQAKVIQTTLGAQRGSDEWNSRGFHGLCFPASPHSALFEIL